MDRSEQGFCITGKKEGAFVTIGLRGDVLIPQLRIFSQGGQA